MKRLFLYQLNLVCYVYDMFDAYTQATSLTGKSSPLTNRVFISNLEIWVSYRLKEMVANVKLSSDRRLYELMKKINS